MQECLYVIINEKYECILYNTIFKRKTRIRLYLKKSCPSFPPL